MNENPNVQEFCKNTQALRVINCSCLGPVKGNCRESNNKEMTAADLEKENQPLRKRKATRPTKGKQSQKFCTCIIINQCTLMTTTIQVMRTIAITCCLVTLVSV